MSRRHDSFTVRPLAPDASTDVTVVRHEAPPTALYYAFIVEVEDEYTGKGRGKKLFRRHALMECIAMAWFDDLVAREAPLPPIDRVARVSGMCHVQLSAVSELLDSIIVEQDGRHRAHIHEGAWIWIRLVREGDLGLPVAVYLPADGSEDPASIGTTPNSQEALLVGIGRLPNNATMRALRFFSDEYGLG